MPTGMFVHGLNVNSPDWHERVFGQPPHKLGRAARALHLLHAKYPETQLMLFGSGATEKNGLKEGDYTIQDITDHFDDLLQFEVFSKMHPVAFRALKNKFERIAGSELKSHNTLTELKYALPLFVEMGLTRIVLVSDYPHFSRCIAHAGQIIEEQDLEGKIEIVGEHSFFRSPKQKLSAVKVFEPESDPKEGIQLGDLAAQLFKVKNRSGFKEEYEALIAKYSA